eukprot:403345521
MDHNLPTFKVIVVGDQSVGKTHIISQYVIGQLPRNPQTTLGVDFQTMKFTDVASGQKGKFLIFDTAGEEKYHAVTAMHFKKVKGCFIVYDVTNRESFEHVQKWLKDALDLTEQDCSIILLANKCDVDHIHEQENLNIYGGVIKKRQVSTEEGMDFAKTHNLQFFEVSAVMDYNIVEAFSQIGSQIMEIHLRNVQNQSN